MAQAARRVEFGVSGCTELDAHLNDALALLRHPFREAVILHLLEGFTCPEVARAQGVSTTAVGARISRAMSRLRRILARRGVMISAAALSDYFVECAAKRAPDELVASCQATAIAAVVGGHTSATAAARIADDAIRAMFWAKLKTMAVAVACAVACGTLIAAAVLLARRLEPGPSAGLSMKVSPGTEVSGVVRGAPGSGIRDPASSELCPTKPRRAKSGSRAGSRVSFRASWEEAR
ncbi:MAG: hypothetical protein JXR37_14765 [Kiritimatiellae bacterium]|nr:hypothetical protein [Kiritimatiellia bacterium]